jgi:hypothetical protein
MRRGSAFTVALALLLAVPAAPAQSQAELRDPWIPPALRAVTPAAPTTGAALQAQVERKLRARFDAADVEGTGALTREQARAAGLGLVANNFDRIDVGRTGKVTFEDLKRYLRSRGARF